MDRNKVPTTVNFNATALTGASDAITLTLSGTSSTTVAITDDSAATTSALESLTINSISVANTLADLQIDGVLTPSVTVTGSTALTITAALDANVTTVDASANSDTVLASVNGKIADYLSLKNFHIDQPINIGDIENLILEKAFLRHYLSLFKGVKSA